MCRFHSFISISKENWTSIEKYMGNFLQRSQIFPFVNIYTDKIFWLLFICGRIWSKRMWVNGFQVDRIWIDFFVVVAFKKVISYGKKKDLIIEELWVVMFMDVFWTYSFFCGEIKQEQISKPFNLKKIKVISLKLICCIWLR